MGIKPSKQIEERLKTMLTRDKMGVGQGFLSALKGDVSHLLGDYFSLSEGVNVAVEPLDDGGYDVAISTKASKIKNFNSSVTLKKNL